MPDAAAGGPDTGPDFHWPSGFSPDEAHGYCRAEALVRAAPPTVFALLGDVPRWPEWAPGITRVRAGPLDRAFDVVSHGRRFEVYVGEHLPPGRLGWSGVGAGVQMYQAWRLTAVAGGTRAVTASVVRGPAARSALPVSSDWARRLNTRWVVRLKRRAENDRAGPGPRVSRRDG
ncbi:SRPBCC family protein [Streptomyces sp. NPDC050400]|uniref:SRPBCC family protein n=1 Tax=Streptomyces sp. NPDC050400 TaxID=3365610 RepID=UPI0037AA1B7E